MSRFRMSVPAVIPVAIASCIACSQAAAADAVAVYTFDNSFASSVAGAPALTVTDPLGLSGFGTDTVNGVSKTVFSFDGNSANAQQAGLSLNTTGLLTSNTNYSLEMVFKFTQNENAWRRIVDVSARQSDTGFYVDPGNRLDIYPVAGGASFSNNVYHDVFLSVSDTTATFYLDGSAQATVTTDLMDIGPGGGINFFLDNVVGGGQSEYSDGSISLIRLYDEALTSVPPPIEPPPVIPPSPVPEPQTWALMLAGTLLLARTARRRARTQADTR